MPLAWNSNGGCQRAFLKLKQALITPSIFLHTDLNSSFEIFMEARKLGLGTILTQTLEGEEKIITHIPSLLT